MASSHRESYGPLKFSNKSPHFFKIILQETLLDGKIEIPKEFIKNYGKCMSGPAALLRVPSGEVWKIEVRKCDGNVWLRKGWRQFSNHYSLKRGQFVVFSYEGKCNFDVVIMDTTASEIQYPYTRNYVMHNSKKFPEIESESEDDIPPSRKTREKSADLPCPRPHKKMRANVNAGASYQSQGEAAVKRKAKGLNGCCDSLNFLQRAKALQLARAFKSENPSFTVVMQPSYVHKGLVNVQVRSWKKQVKKFKIQTTSNIPTCRTELPITLGTEAVFFTGRKAAYLVSIDIYLSS
ncbi:hypothetical protein COLO4_27399 [Corchorus olitorius]|uniref:TF-B3 domain-containing protein n=1 Tax=Corchorus olitorius TaxID=93759 RepID=A0A1R3HRG4_9ROSI|nr:hypothetical protein COLO4_27399 [Corchorus olitorius]